MSAIVNSSFAVIAVGATAFIPNVGIGTMLSAFLYRLLGVDARNNAISESIFAYQYRIRAQFATVLLSITRSCHPGVFAQYLCIHIFGK